MSSFMQQIQDNYKMWHKGSNREVDTWFLMESPGPVIVMLGLYLLFVIKIGPAMMKNRKPMQLKNTIVIYNAIQVLFSIFLVYKGTRVEIPFKSLLSSSCQRGASPKNMKLLTDSAWWYFIAKLSEFLDTVFFILRKKDNQVTGLHVYHHSMTMFFSWCYLKYAPGEQGAIIGSLNSFVHVIMYTYYMLSAMGPKYQKYLWWKKYVTVIQLAQFCIMVSYMVLFAMNNCGYQKSVTYFFLINAAIFFFLFMNFYRNAYKKSVKVNGDIKMNFKPQKNEGYIDDTQAYLQITKDVILLNNSEKLGKAE